jgi:hypothetical protein
VARCVGEDEGARRPREIAVGDVDGDALLALRLKAVEEQRKVRRIAAGPVEAGVPGERAQLIVVDPVAVEQQPADQRRLAVVDAAAGDEP